ncbi:Serpentine receptor class gamma [Caenorhabditis elegans]|uniref:Serpentine receptor class gamma n=1 Tax=Caenorhabditis elegans TaxID=6239 RepID=Q23076_CAEEL|nr:Serpentine receptor class gamma [Caenorhabditis elegans]CCD69052.1 Serpentine receptor class gamma [Caenorhabditis elegans]|eukprot:NP_504443.2 Serpentine receptor class gamma [Caenorhabditis elegans]
MSLNITVSMEEVNLDLRMKILTVVELGYGIPSFICMVAFLVMMGSSKVFKSSFYRLVQLDLLTNILLYLNTWIALRLESQPSCIFLLKSIEELLPGFLTWCKYLTWWFLHIQFLSACSLSAHRISSFWWPTIYEMFWSQYYVACGLAFVIYSFMPTLIWHEFAVEVSIENGILMKTLRPTTIMFALNVTAGFSTAYFIIISVLGITTAYIVYKMEKSLSAIYSKVAKKLTKIAFTYSAVYLGILFWTVATALNFYIGVIPDLIMEINNTIMVFCSGLMTLSLPYVLLFFDTNVKKQFFPKSATTDITLISSPSVPYN